MKDNTSESVTSLPALVTVLMRAARVLEILHLNPKDEDILTGAAELAAHLRAHGEALLAANAKRSANAKVGKGRPAFGYTIDVTSGPQWVCWGMSRTAFFLSKVPGLLGEKLVRWNVTPQSITRALSVYGEWSRNIETDNGLQTVTVRRATERECKQQLEREAEDDRKPSGFGPRPRG